MSIRPTPVKDKPFVVLCDCGVETMQVRLFVKPDEDFEGYVSFSSWWQQNQPWRNRLRLVWLALRGKEYYFSEVRLDRADTERLQWYLAGQLQQGVHLDFTATSNTAAGVHPDFTATSSTAAASHDLPRSDSA